MKYAYRFIHCVFVIFLVCTPTAMAESPRFLFASGAIGGTYHALAQSLRTEGLDLKNINSQGCVENISLIKQGQANAGFCQLDIITNAYLYDKNVRHNIKILMPIYREEIHVLTNREFDSVSSLRKKRISIGDAKSGTNTTARIILGVEGINADNSQFIESGTKESWNKLNNNLIDAMIVVSGAPNSILSEPSAQIFFPSFSNNSVKLLAGPYFPYQKTELQKTTYDWLQTNVSTMAIESVIIVRADKNEDEALEFLNFIENNISLLQKHHIKWSQYNKNKTEKYYSKKPEWFHKSLKKFIQ